MAVKWIEDLGATLGKVKLGLTGVVLKNNSGNLLIRNPGDTADAEVQASRVVAGTIDLTGTAGAGAINAPTQSATPSAPASGFKLFANASSLLSWVGSGGFVRTLDAAITASRTWTLPDKTGTIALTDLISGATATVTFNDQRLSRFGTLNTVTSSTAYTLSAVDNGVQLLVNAASAATVTIPTGLPTGFGVVIRQVGSGQVSIVAGSGVNLLSADGLSNIAKQYASVAIFNIGTNNYCIDGYLA